MRRSSATLFGLFFIIQIVQPQIINKNPLSERITGYKITANLDINSKTVKGSMESFWVNKSTDTVPDIRMHLYMNAFRNENSTVNKEFSRLEGSESSDSGWIEIKSMWDKNGFDLSSRMQYISPDDGNRDDRTVLRILLPKPVMPGDTVFIKSDFETKLPHLIRRTGYSDDFYFVAQWFPKFGVYEPAGMRYAVKGGWNCHQFHANSEFYADHSVYDVTITTPPNYIIGSCGMLMTETVVTGVKKTSSFRAEDIVDFAWTAWPGFAVYTDHWNNVEITLLIPKDRVAQVNRQFTAVKQALEYLNDNVGKYPWPHLTIIDPPAKGAGAGGMEYTTLFTSESSFLMPSFFHMPEMVTVHEFGHAYFMGILASNEFEEPWLDEGVNTFWEQRIMDHYYGSRSGMIDHTLLKIPDISYARVPYVLSASRQAVSNNEFSWNYPHDTYDMMSYLKASTWLHTLMGIVGEETMNNIFKEYYKEWAFKHPSGKDFVNVVNKVVRIDHGMEFGPDMNWFFNQTLYGTGICDYKVIGFENKKIGKSDNKIASSDTTNINKTDQNYIYSSVAKLERAGEVILPVEVLIHFSNGEEVLEKWDGKSRYKDFSYTGEREIKWVKIDPEFKIKMDVNYINNSWTDEPNQVPIKRMINKLISFMQFYLSFILL